MALGVPRLFLCALVKSHKSMIKLLAFEFFLHKLENYIVFTEDMWYNKSG